MLAIREWLYAAQRTNEVLQQSGHLNLILLTGLRPLCLQQPALADRHRAGVAAHACEKPLVAHNASFQRTAT